MRVVTLILACLAAALLPAADNRDPLTPVKPRARPSFRNLVPPEEFAQRSAPYQERIDALKAQPNQNAPAYGRRIINIQPEGWADRNGLKPGDIITQIGGARLWGDDLPERGPTTPIEVYFPATDRVRTFRCDQEKLDLWLSLDWRPENIYLGSNRQGARWDDFVLLGILARGDDPDLAETAFNRAVAAGYRADVLADQVGAEIALCQNRPAVAAEFASFVNWNSRQESAEVYPLLLLRVAMANYHWQRAKDIVMSGKAQFATLGPIGPVRLIEIHEGRPVAERTLPPPSVRAESMQRLDLTDRIQGSNNLAIEHRQPGLRAGQPLQLKIETAHWRKLAIETPEPTPNVEFSVRFSGKPTDDVQDNYQKWFVITARNMTPPDEESDEPFFDQQLARIAINEWGMVYLGCGGNYSELFTTDPTVANLDNREHEVRILKFGGQLELFLNGHRVLYGPVSDGPYPVQFELMANGTTIDIHSVQLAEYVERL